MLNPSVPGLRFLERGCVLDFCGGWARAGFVCSLERITNESAAGLKSPFAKAGPAAAGGRSRTQASDSTALRWGRREIEGGFWRLGRGQHGFSLGIGLPACQGRGSIEVVVQTGKQPDGEIPLNPPLQKGETEKPQAKGGDPAVESMKRRAYDMGAKFWGVPLERGEGVHVAYGVIHYGSQQSRREDSSRKTYKIHSPPSNLVL